MLPCKMLKFIENSLEGMFLIFDLHVFSSDTILIALEKGIFNMENGLTASELTYSNFSARFLQTKKDLFS